MRNTILFLIFLILSFSINIVFYYVSEDYRDFLKNLKNDNNVVNIDSSSLINDDFLINLGDINTSKNEIDDNQQLVEEKIIDNITVIEENREIWKDISEITLWRNYKEITDLFISYWLQKLELNTNLFDLTDEYPDEYLEFFSKDLTLYFFPSKRYNELVDIFSVLENELPFTINEVNNFWDNSFFINLNDDINDNIIRLVISNKWVVFWLKIRKNDYNLVREKLNTLRNN